MILGNPAPFVEAVDEVIRAQHSGSGLSAMQRMWLPFCVTAVLVNNSRGSLVIDDTDNQRSKSAKALAHQ